jgi:hypothetical protein
MPPKQREIPANPVAPIDSEQFARLTNLIQTLSDKVTSLELQRATFEPNDQSRSQTDPNVAHLQSRLNQLENAINASPTNTSNSGVSLNAEKVKVALPDKFDGNCLNYDTFKASLDNFFALKASVYAADEIKVRTIGTLLSKQALQWYSTLVKSDSALLRDFNSFMAEFKRLFSDPNSKMKSQMLIKKLKQGAGSVLSYYTRFRAIAINTGFDSEAQIAAFRTGLSDDIKDILATSLEEPGDIESLVTMAIKIDTRLFDRRMEKEIKPKLPGVSSVVEDRPSINLALINGKISKVERERRIKSNLCLYCGLPGHSVKECPNKKTKSVNGKKVPPSSVAAIAGDPSGSQP